MEAEIEKIHESCPELKTIDAEKFLPLAREGRWRYRTAKELFERTSRLSPRFSAL
jgi:hypothetical protein